MTVRVSIIIILYHERRWKNVLQRLNNTLSIYCSSVQRWNDVDFLLAVYFLSWFFIIISGYLMVIYTANFTLLAYYVHCSLNHQWFYWLLCKNFNAGLLFFDCIICDSVELCLVIISLFAVLKVVQNRSRVPPTIWERMGLGRAFYLWCENGEF